jgi:D-tyrosyl-tRNA(Tyr) deacylase
MRMVVQRVSHASVTVDGAIAGEIGPGLLILLGVAGGDTEADARYLADKALGLRIFPDEDRKMNRNVLEAGGSLLVVSQFTLYGDVRKGRRPSFDRAALPDQAKALYESFIEAARSQGIHVETGVFQAMMQVELCNEGPVTILADSEKHI